MVLRVKNGPVLDNVYKSGKMPFKIHIVGMLEKGRAVVRTKDELEDYPIGSNISYKSVSGNYRIGGCIVEYLDNHFVYTPDFKHKIRAKYSRVKKMWVGDVFKTRGDFVSITETDQEPTKHKVMLGDTVVYYASCEFDMKRYKLTVTYKRMASWWSYFGYDKKVDVPTL